MLRRKMLIEKSRREIDNENVSLGGLAPGIGEPRSLIGGRTL